MTYPPAPANMGQFADQLLANVRLGQYEDGFLRSERTRDLNEDIHILFYDENFIRGHMSEITNLFIDATFDIIPRVQGTYQLLSIMGVTYGHVSIQKPIYIIIDLLFII